MTSLSACTLDRSHKSSYHVTQLTSGELRRATCWIPIEDLACYNSVRLVGSSLPFPRNQWSGTKRVFMVFFSDFGLQLLLADRSVGL